jgi:3-oxoacyl-[acyl-carrier-protein] synthase III
MSDVEMGKVNPSIHRVVVTGTGSYLPGDPVPNNKIDEVLGPLDNAPVRVKSFVETVGKRLLRDSGVENRHFAIDPKTHKLTHTLAMLAEEAARRALDTAGMSPTDIDLLLLSSPSYDQTTPPTTTILQERLGIESCAEMEVHSNCSGVGKCMQIAYDALRLGRYKTALITYAQLSSVYLRSCYYNQPQMNKTQAALRYILSDGAGACILKALDTGTNGKPVPHELMGTYVESVGGNRPPAMTAGGGVADLVEAASPMLEVLEKGSHHLDQDFSAVNRDAVPYLMAGAKRMAQSLGMVGNQIDHYVYSIPSRQLYEGNLDKVLETWGVQADRVKFRATNTGYCGGASILVHFDEMIRSGEIQPGQTVLLHSVESSKWMSAGFIVKW